MAETLSARLGLLELEDADGNKVRLGPLWADQPAVIIFLRHWG